ncbi:MAG: LuxR C-terminal-related transcriptional regulator [Haloechinothrix sp.]
MTGTATHDVVGAQVRRGLRVLTQLDGFSAALGGPVSHGGTRLVLSELRGMRTEMLRGIVIHPGIGLGGRVLERRSPVAVDDYVGSAGITHQFDRAVTADNVRSAIAFPIRVRGEIRAVLYGAARTSIAFGEHTVEAAMAIGRQVAHNILIEEEVERRIERLRAEEWRRVPAGEQLAEVNAELISIASSVPDRELRDRLINLSERLSGDAGTVRARALGIQLSRREADVLAQLAAGYTNAEIAERLSILPTTVKSHLKNTMRKLGTRNRVETISAARYAGLLP